MGIHKNDALDKKITTETQARVTLRISDWLKNVIDTEAARNGLSQNTYMTKAVLQSITEDARRKVSASARSIRESIDPDIYDELDIQRNQLNVLADLDTAMGAYNTLMDVMSDKVSELDILNLLELHYSKVLYNLSDESTVTDEMRELIATRSNILIGGNTGSGKTTYMNKLRELIFADKSINRVIELYSWDHDRADVKTPHTTQVTSLTSVKDPEFYDLLLKMPAPDYLIVDKVHTAIEANFVYLMSYKCPVLINMHGSSIESTKSRFDKLLLEYRDTAVDANIFDKLVYIKRDELPEYK